MAKKNERMKQGTRFQPMMPDAENMMRRSISGVCNILNTVIDELKRGVELELNLRILEIHEHALQ